MPRIRKAKGSSEHSQFDWIVDYPKGLDRSVPGKRWGWSGLVWIGNLLREAIFSRQ